MPLPLDAAVRTWTPLLTGDDASRAEAVVSDIAAALRDPATPTIDPGFATSGVAGGASGAAIFFAERSAITKDEEDAATAYAFLDRAIELASEESPTLPLYVGTVGVGWTLAFLERSILDPDTEPNDVDELVRVGLASGRWREFDLIRGLTGAGVYVLERGQSLDGIVEGLRACSVETDDGVTWWVDPATVPKERAEMFPNGYYDVGIAHGQAGVVALLAAAYAAGNTESAKPLLDDTLKWLLAQRLPEDRGPGRYPLLFGKDSPEPPRGGRMAWCYGDIGVAVGLLAAGQALKDEALLTEARDLALLCAARPSEHAGVLDASFCHGSSGLALLFGRLYQAFGDEELAEAARLWARVLMDQIQPGGPIGGVRYSVPDGDERGWESRAGMLEGATGVALTLQALTSDRSPDWDLVFLSRPVR